MSWIKENKFLAGLIGGTLAVAIILYVVGSRGAKKYEAANEQFTSVSDEVSSILKLPLEPTIPNRDGKTKALDDYRKATDDLQATFESFRPKEIKNVSPQEFTDHLKAANKEVREAFDAAGTKVPDAFLFCGFERYRDSLAVGSATGILDYELAGVKNIMLALAKAGPTELKNVYRPSLSEEDGKEYKPGDSEVARAMPLEITFMGPEKVLRAFMSSISKMDGQFVVVRSLRVTNDKKDPPRTADAKFDKPKETQPAAGGATDVFGGGFVIPGEEPEKPADTPAPAGGAPAPAPAAAPEPAAPADTGRILAQVLGNEEVQVFIRLDIMEFLPAKKLP